MMEILTKIVTKEAKNSYKNSYFLQKSYFERVVNAPLSLYSIIQPCQLFLQMNLFSNKVGLKSCRFIRIY